MVCGLFYCGPLKRKSSDGELYMPGLLGIICDNEREWVSSLLDDMILAMKLKAWYKVDKFQDDAIGLGLVSLGILKSSPQPLWNENHSVCIMMEGEIFNKDDIEKELMERGYYCKTSDDTALVLALYDAFGEDFAIKLNGAFTLTIWDQRINKLIVTNDRLGLCPLYYSHNRDYILFASKVGALLADTSLQHSIDSTAIAQFLTFDHILGNRTLLRSVSQLPPASKMTYQNGNLSVQSYWKIEFPELYRRYDRSYYTEGLHYYLRQAIKRQAPGELPAGVLLSGGLDSRMVLAFLQNISPSENLHTFTFGIPGCDDVRYAQEVSARVGTRHHVYELQPDYLLRFVEEGIRLTEGMQNCIHMHALATLHEEVKYAKVIFKGFFGDALLGYFTFLDFFATYNDDDLFQLLFDYYPLTFNLSEFDHLFSKGFNDNLEEAVIETFREVVTDSNSNLAANQYLQFDLRQRQRRMGLNGVELVRSQAIVRTPFCDKDLIDFVLMMPPGYRLGRNLVKDVFIQEFPELAKIPFTETGYPLVSCRRDLLMRFNRQVQWRLQAAGIKWFPVTKKREYSDYNGWMRTVLRAWVEGILLSERTLDRGYFNPDFLINLVREHMAGADHAKKLSALIAIEMWHRQFLD